MVLGAVCLGSSAIGCPGDQIEEEVIPNRSNGEESQVGFSSIVQ